MGGKKKAGDRGLPGGERKSVEARGSGLVLLPEET